MTPAQAAAARRLAGGPSEGYRPQPSIRREEAPLRVLPKARPRPALVRRRWALLVSFTLLLGSLMAVVVAQAMVAENQVRLTKVQSQLQAAKAQHSAEQLQVGQMETPSRITRMAQQQHLATPSQIQQVPSVPLSRPISPPKVAPSSGAAPSTAAGG